MILFPLGVSSYPPSSRKRRSTPQPALRYRDVFILTHLLVLKDEIRDDSGKVTQSADASITGLRQAGIPLRVLASDERIDRAVLEDLVTMTGPDVVTYTSSTNVWGLERKVVVVMGESEKELTGARLAGMSRATAQVVHVVHHSKCPIYS